MLNSVSIDGMVYTRGSAEDYDLIANVTGDQEWSWDRLQYYIRKVCACHPPYLAYAYNGSMNDGRVLLTIP